MKVWLLIAVFGPLQLCAQTDSLSLIRVDSPQAIESTLSPAYYNTYSLGRRVNYTRGGLPMRISDVERNIRASGSGTATDELDEYEAGRRVSLSMCIVGSVLIMGSLIGQVIVAVNDPSGRLVTSSRGFSYGWNRGIGFVGSSIAGFATAGEGLVLWPGDHLRQAVQYYNQSLRPRRVSWQLRPYGSWTHFGVNMVGRF